MEFKDGDVLCARAFTIQEREDILAFVPIIGTSKDYWKIGLYDIVYKTVWSGVGCDSFGTTNSVQTHLNCGGRNMTQEVLDKLRKPKLDPVAEILEMVTERKKQVQEDVEEGFDNLEVDFNYLATLPHTYLVLDISKLSDDQLGFLKKSINVSKYGTASSGKAAITIKLVGHNSVSWFYSDLYDDCHDILKVSFNDIVKVKEV